MIKVEKIETYGWEAAIRGMRNPMNSWDKSDSHFEWGGKLVENLVQAVARDILRDKMLALNALGYDIRAHVHDDVILSVPWQEVGSERVSAIMGAALPWTHGLPLSAESYECEYYQKD